MTAAPLQDAADGVDVQVWHAHRVVRGLSAFWIAASVLAAPAFLVAGFGGYANLGPVGGVYMAAMTTGCAAFIHRLAFHPLLRADDEGVVIRNVTDEHEVRWEEIKSITPGYSGLCFTRHHGPAVHATAVQKSNYAQARGKFNTRSDVIARLLAERATGAGTPPPAIPGPEASAPARRTARWLLAAGALLITGRIAIEFV